MTDGTASASSTTTSPPRAEHARFREITDVAARLFAERGYHATSMDDIAREIGMLKGSLYYWIQSKEDLLKAILQGAMSETIAVAERIEALDLSAPEKIRMLMHAHLESWIRNPNNYAVSLYETRHVDEATLAEVTASRTSLEVVYRRMFRQGAKSGELNLRDEDVTLAVNSVLGMMNWFPRWYRSDGKASLEQIADLMADIVLDGMAVGPSRGSGDRPAASPKA
jgi:AcrR family transcriptional regulator